MSLDKFISTVRAEVAKRFDLKTDAEIDAFFIGLEESAKDNQEALEKRDKMLRDTIAELCEAKRLLKAAVEDMNDNEICYDIDTNTYKVCTQVDKFSCDTFKWRYTAEALKLLGEQNDENN